MRIHVRRSSTPALVFGGLGAVAALIAVVGTATCRGGAFRRAADEIAKGESAKKKSKAGGDDPAGANAIVEGAKKELAASVKGTIHASGAELGDFDLALTACGSGEVRGFFGVDFYAADGDELRLRYVHDEAKGDVLKIHVPKTDGKLLVLGADRCKVLDASLEKTNVSTWTPKGKIRHLVGHVTFDCAYADGKGHVSGDVSFANCH